jgi:CRP/FNR family cyclic AMP-dependent transcriptional regulator
MPGPPIELIRGVPFFAGLSEKEAAALAAEFVQRDYPAGAVILIEGQQGYAFFLVERGEATVVRRGAEAGHLGPGDSFGELALFDRGARRAATITAATDVRCWSLPIFTFRPYVEARPAVAWQLLEYLAAKLRSPDD